MPKSFGSNSMRFQINLKKHDTQFNLKANATQLVLWEASFQLYQHIRFDIQTQIWPNFVMCLIWKKNGFNKSAPSEGPILSPLPFPQQLNKQAQVIKRILNFKIEPSSSKLMPGVQGANPQ